MWTPYLLGGDSHLTLLSKSLASVNFQISHWIHLAWTIAKMESKRAHLFTGMVGPENTRNVFIMSDICTFFKFTLGTFNRIIITWVSDWLMRALELKFSHKYIRDIALCLLARGLTYVCYWKNFWWVQKYVRLQRSPVKVSKQHLIKIWLCKNSKERYMVQAPVDCTITAVIAEAEKLLQDIEIDFETC
jgi:hypothetical protein